MVPLLIFKVIEPFEELGLFTPTKFSFEQPKDKRKNIRDILIIVRFSFHSPILF